MKMIIRIALSLVLLIGYSDVVTGQLSADRMADIAEIKVERFKNILDLTPAQSQQLRRETINMLVAQGSVASSKNVLDQFNKNLEKYYASLSTFKPQQVATLKIMDAMERQSRRETYQDLLKVYGQSSEFAIEVAAYNWNVIMPILVSYRKDLDRYISPGDKAIIAELRNKMILKYNFIENIRDHSPSAETEAIVSTIQDELIIDINESGIPRILRKYDERIIQVRNELKKYEYKIRNDIQDIYEQHMLPNHKVQASYEKELLGMLGISNLLRDSFFLLMDGDSRSTSFKINALLLMANELEVTSQF